jgi:hypothetical protein
VHQQQLLWLLLIVFADHFEEALSMHQQAECRFQAQT